MAPSEPASASAAHAAASEPWRAFTSGPLVPVAVAVTAGLTVARTVSLPFSGLCGAASVCIGCWYLLRYSYPRKAVALLWLAAGALAAAYYQQYRNEVADNDISRWLQEEPAPCRIRGVLIDEPLTRHPRPRPLTHIPSIPTTSFTLAVSAVEGREGWVDASGRVRVVAETETLAVHAGDTVEVFGWLSSPARPDNPGEYNWYEHYRDQRITAIMRVRRPVIAVVRLDAAEPWNVARRLAQIHHYGENVLRRHLGPSHSGLAIALLLGDTAALDTEEWQAYVRTGVVHVLAISGFHLAVLSGIVWFCGRWTGLGSRTLAIAVMAAVILYAALTGARPSVVRSAAMVCAYGLAVLLGRPVHHANAFALAWLAVVIHCPTDIFHLGCQLSFLSVFVLIWGAGRWLVPPPPTPQQQLLQETYGPLRRRLQAVIRWIYQAYLISLLLAVVNAPLILYWHNILSPVGIVLGPPVILASSIALVCGFVVILLAPLGSWLTAGPAGLMELALASCGWLVRQADGLPGSTIYAPAPAVVWVIGFHAGLIAAVLAPPEWSWRGWKALVVWVLLGLVVQWHRPDSDELRVTFLAVGHGGCTVVETPDGRVFLYDAGTMSGPDVVRQRIAPYLWHRGVRRIDELFLSHGDMDHFNGVPELLRRFRVGRITTTPTFADRHTEGIDLVLAAIERAGVPVRTTAVGEHLVAGEVEIAVLHPPESGPPGPENVRSMVLHLRYQGHGILLTGDLEGIGQEMVRRQPIEPVAVMMAPHHGGKSANAPLPDAAHPTSWLARWAQPRLVVSPQRPSPTSHLRAAYPYSIVWDTASRGAITVRVHASGVVAEAFRTGERLVVTYTAPPPRR